MAKKERDALEAENKQIAREGLILFQKRVQADKEYYDLVQSDPAKAFELALDNCLPTYSDDKTPTK